MIDNHANTSKRSFVMYLKTKIKMRQLINTFLLLTVIACGSPSQGDNENPPSKSVHEAAFFGDLKTIEGHIAAGSDLNVKDEYGSTPLNIAITFNKEAVAKALIEGGADLSITTTDGSSPLHSACFFGRTEIVKALLKKGVNQQAKNNYGATAMETISTPFETVKPIYDQLSKDLGPLGFRLDYDELKAAREEIARLLTQ
jgi:ankyrin repeat protein